MNSCLDTERIADLLRSLDSDPAARSHMATCARCREEFELLLGTVAIFEDEIEVPADLIRRTELAIDAASHAVSAGIDVERESWGPLGTWLLGAGTAAAAVVVTGVPSGTGLASLIAYSGAIGAVVVLYFRSGSAAPGGVSP